MFRLLFMDTVEVSGVAYFFGYIWRTFGGVVLAFEQ